MSRHLPDPPRWTCRECAADWPCQTRREQLRELYGGDRVLLHIAMAPEFVQAVDDLQDLRPGAVWDRFLGWIRRGP
ncbi:MAG TPA: flavin reductase [Micromonosporaceae bacterium]|nr:flavin reductase [Micromonosporaceae bacterium]